jgi:FMN reductase (NADPH)
MSDIIRHLQAHRSIRQFKPTAITEEQVAQIIASAQSASTSSNLQAYSVIGIRDASTKRQLAELAGNQRYVEDCPLFLVWCADLHRTQTAVQLRQEDDALKIPQNVETFLVATVDAALAAQNAAVAAEALGLGTVFIGGIRNDMRRVIELLQLPQLVYPVFGMCLGEPDQAPTPRPRLPRRAIYHSERYSVPDQAEGIRAYDETLIQYYADRTGGGKQTSWSGELTAKLRPERLRPDLYEVLTAQGFRLQ